MNDHSRRRERLHARAAAGLLAHAVLALCLAVSLVGLPAVAVAADDFCGVDTDRNGSVDNACPEPDKDHDGYPSSSSYAGPYGSDVDCDDSDFFVYPGIETAGGCSAGNYRTCQANGTFSSCSPVSAFTCHSGSGSTYWVGSSGVTTACGSNGTPCNWFCFSNSALTCYHAPVAGDCIVFKSGSYTGNWSDGGTTRQLYFYNKDGTLSNPIIFRNEPGSRPVLNGTSTAPNDVNILYSEDSDYVTVRGFEIDGTSDYSSAGIHITGGIAPKVFDNYIHHIGGKSDNNLSCVNARAGNVGVSIHHNLMKDCYEVGDATNQNSGAVTVMDDTGVVSVVDNVVVNSTPVGYGLRIKHASDTCTPTISRNFVKNVSQYAFKSENKDTTVKNNWVKNCDAMALAYGGIGTTSGWFKDSVFSYNTLQLCGLANFSPVWTDSLGHQSYSGATVFTADHNIMEDDNASYDGDAGDGVTRMCEYNCTNGEFAAAVGKAIWSNNVYYSSGTSTLRFGYFGQAGGGADYGSLALWKAAGFDVGSVQADPGLDADGISATYPNHGWRAGVFTDAAPSSTGSTSPGTIYNFLRRRR